MTPEFDDTFKMRRDLKRIAWRITFRRGVFSRMLLLCLIPFLVMVTFWILALAGGVVSSLAANQHLSQTLHFTQRYNDGVMWTILADLVSGVLAVVSNYVALTLVRTGVETFDIGDEVRRGLHWRYLLNYFLLYVVRWGIRLVFFVAVTFLTIFLVLANGTVVHGGTLGVNLIVIFLVTLVLSVSIVVSLGWHQTIYLMKDRIDAGVPVNPFRLLGDSWRMMRDFKFDLLILYLSLLGWYILSVVTLGIAYVILMPYFRVVQATFFENVCRFDKQRAELAIDFKK